MSYITRPIVAIIAVSCFYKTSTSLVTGFSPAPQYASITSDNNKIIFHNKQQEYTNKRSSTSTSSLQLFPLDQSAAILLAEEAETWRQYVPLGVSLLVITDILLGNPIANLALAPMRQATLDNDDDDSAADGAGVSKKLKKKFVKNPNERVDTDALGQAAVQRARYSMDLRTFLEENKSDEDKYEDMRKKIDAMAQEFDSKKKPSD